MPVMHGGKKIVRAKRDINMNKKMEDQREETGAINK